MCVCVCAYVCAVCLPTSRRFTEGLFRLFLDRRRYLASILIVQDHWSVAPTGPSSLHPAREYKEPPEYGFFSSFGSARPIMLVHCSIYLSVKIIHFNIAGQLSPLVAPDCVAVWFSTPWEKTNVSHWVVVTNVRARHVYLRIIMCVCV